MIKKIKLENFKCFTGQEINFKKLTVLVGENASGKSSVIQSILLAKEISEISNNLNTGIDDMYSIPLNVDKLLELGTLNEIYNGFNEKEEIRILIKANIDLDDEYLIEDDEYKILAKVELSKKNTFFQMSSEEVINFIGFDTIYYIASERLGPRKHQEISPGLNKLCGYKGEYTFDTINRNLQNKIDENRVFDIFSENKKIGRAHV